MRFECLSDTINEPKERQKRERTKKEISKTTHKKLSAEKKQEVYLSTPLLPAHISGHYWDLVKNSDLIKNLLSEESSSPEIPTGSLSKDEPKPRKLLSTRGKTLYFKRARPSASELKFLFSQRTYSTNSLVSSKILWGPSSNQ